VHAFAAIRDLFLERFRRPDDARWQDISALYDHRQGTSETTEQYVNDMLKRGEAANATEEQIRFAVLHGLRDNIKNVVLQHEKSDLQQIVKWGITAEMISDKASSEITNAVERLEKMMAKMNVTSLAASENPGGVAQNFSEQVLPLVQNHNMAGTVSFGRPTQNQTEFEYYGPPFQNYIFRGRGRGGRGARGRPWSSPRQGTNVANYGSQQASYAQSFSQPFAPQQYQYSQHYQVPQQYQYSQNSGHACSNCGRIHGQGQCKAYGLRCYGCGKLNHFRRCCRSYNPQGTQ